MYASAEAYGGDFRPRVYCAKRGDGNFFKSPRTVNDPPRPNQNLSEMRLSGDGLARALCAVGRAILPERLTQFGLRLFRELGHVDALQRRNRLHASF